MSVILKKIYFIVADTRKELKKGKEHMVNGSLSVRRA